MKRQMERVVYGYGKNEGKPLKNFFICGIIKGEAFVCVMKKEIVA